jgi:hypothetical protein
MGRVGRLAGALIAETGGAYYLIGHPKVPCDWRTHGFEPPGELDARVRPVVRLVVSGEQAPGTSPSGPPTPSDRAARALGTPQLIVEIEGEALPRLLAERFVIPRTGSVSERLWRIVTGESDEGEPPPDVIPARWLGELPPPVWQIVRDTVLRCT